MASMEDMMAAVEAAAAKKTGATTGTVKGHLSEDELKQLKLTELKAMADDFGLNASTCKTKADYAALIAGVEVEADLEGEGTLTAEEVEALEPGDVLTVEADDGTQSEAQADEDQDEGGQDFTGVVMVIYTGMVNLRDQDGNVDGMAMQGQTFETTGTVQRNGATWYKITDRHGKGHLISAQVVRQVA